MIDEGLVLKKLEEVLTSTHYLRQDIVSLKDDVKDLRDFKYTAVNLIKTVPELEKDVENLKTEVHVQSNKIVALEMELKYQNGRLTSWREAGAWLVATAIGLYTAIKSLF